MWSQLYLQLAYVNLIAVSSTSLTLAVFQALPTWIQGKSTHSMCACGRMSVMRVASTATTSASVHRVAYSTMSARTENKTLSVVTGIYIVGAHTYTHTSTHT